MKHIMETCPICQRKILEYDITSHHYIPKSEGGSLETTIRICKTCHRTLHFFIPLNEIRLYDTIEKIRENESIQAYIHWIETKKGWSHYSPKKIMRELMTA